MSSWRKRSRGNLLATSSKFMGSKCWNTNGMQCDMRRLTNRLPNNRAIWTSPAGFSDVAWKCVSVFGTAQFSCKNHERHARVRSAGRCALETPHVS